MNDSPALCLMAFVSCVTLLSGVAIARFGQSPVAAVALCITGIFIFGVILIQADAITSARELRENPESNQ